MFGPSHVGNMMVGRPPEVERLVGRPELATAHATPEDVVIKLAAEQEIAGVHPQPMRVIFALHALHLEGVEQQVPAARHQPEQNEIAQEHLADPACPEYHAASE